MGESDPPAQVFVNIVLLIVVIGNVCRMLCLIYYRRILINKIRPHEGLRPDFVFAIIEICRDV